MEEGQSPNWGCSAKEKKYNNALMVLREILITQSADRSLHTLVAGTTNSASSNGQQ
jgi:hypothetical protein